MIPELTKLEKFYEEMIKDPNHRSKSFEHCYSYFQNIKDKDKAMLHIAFYLSSWGMYRGSSFLLQKDYKIYDKVIDLLKKEKYKQLTNLENVEENDIEKYIELIYNLYSELEIELDKIRLNYYISINKKVKNKISATLITKIMLGTIGCIPAYDRFF